MPLILHNPTSEQLAELIESSKHKAAKWVRYRSHILYFRPEDFAHAKVARMASLPEYEKGIAITSTASN